MKPTLKSKKTEYYFIKRSCENFYKDLLSLYDNKDNLPREEYLNIMFDLEQISEAIDYLVSNKRK